ncbi:PREDICTED: uncharacterized protein LOC105136642 isoform X3 [Populus euphratica]|uniref:Uncharacterized protein LOC105136642 isoform X3 n=1 Tax=Populus euphratica TaxID=75702 RepID=A0AAJ6Y2V2_POPEU|nr:PREDICTED: uncharacterized protein LOC105136642 isoform X3 [Populus euphratica]
MVAYAAAHCPWKEHTHQLRRGGELLTHVSLLMLHLGLSAQYEYNANAGPIGLLKAEEYKEYREAERKYLGGIGATSGDELEEYHEARDKYEEGIAAISGSSPEESLKYSKSWRQIQSMILSIKSESMNGKSKCLRCLSTKS